MRSGIRALVVLVIAGSVAACGSTAASPRPSPSAAAHPTPTLIPTPLPTVPQGPTSLGVNGPQTIHVLENPVDWAEVKVGSLTGCKEARCLGDYLVGHSSIDDAATNDLVGTLVTECFVVDAASGLYHCPSTTITLTGRGRSSSPRIPTSGTALPVRRRTGQSSAVPVSSSARPASSRAQRTALPRPATS